MEKKIKFQKPPYLNAANLISLFRLVLLPVYFYFLIYYLRWQQGEELGGVTTLYYYITVALVPIILLTDLLDGWVARKFNLVNPLGAFLDPLADKFFAFFTMVALAWVEQIPLWLPMLVFFKEVFILIGWLLLFVLGYDTDISPSKIGKFSCVCQGVLVFAGLLSLPGGQFFSWQAFPLYPLADLLNRPWFHLLTAGATAIAGIQYILVGLQRAHPVEAGTSTGAAVLKLESSESKTSK
jgi:phosphatidylglycerophosphate synthase